jgi:hypothetical protein
MDIFAPPAAPSRAHANSSMNSTEGVMPRFAPLSIAALMALACATATGCGAGQARLGRPETFHWVAQPIAFSPPPARWQREGDNGGGMLGVRFVLTGGGGQCISVLANRLLAERDRRVALRGLIARGASLSRREFLDSLSLARARTDNPTSEREAATAEEVNAALDRAMSDYLGERPGFVASDLEAALRAAESYEITLEEVLPSMRLVPERMPHTDWWRIGYEHDTTLAGLPAFASEDTLIADDRPPLLYHEIFWVVNGCAFKAIFQGTKQNLGTFYRVVDSITFPEPEDVASN